MKRTESALLLTVLLVALLSLSPGLILAATEGSSTGSFTTSNVAPVVNSVQLYDTGDSTTDSMTPLTQYYVKVNVTDNNTLNDVGTVTATVYFDTGGSYSEGECGTSGDTQDIAILTWENGSGFSIDPSASTTWAIVSGSCSAPTLTNSSGDFEFHFKPGKVARENTGADKWHIEAKAVDDDAATDKGADQNNDVNWYGEISSVTASVGFGTVSLGCSGSQSATAVSANYISNGAYDEQIKSGSWSGTNPLTLDTADTNPGSGELALKADDDATVADSVQVTGSYVTIDDAGTITTESGDTQANNNLWLWLGSAGIVDDEYTATLYYQIANGS